MDRALERPLAASWSRWRHNQAMLEVIWTAINGRDVEIAGQLEHLVEVERLGPARRVPPEPLEDRPRLARAHGRTKERPHLLSPRPEKRPNPLAEAGIARSIDRRLSRLEHENGRFDLRPRPEGPGADAPLDPRASPELDEKGGGAVGLRPRPGAQSLGGFELHRERRAAPIESSLEEGQDEGRRDLVGQVRHPEEGPEGAQSAFDVRIEPRLSRERVGDDDVDVRVARQLRARERSERRIDLDREHEASLLRKVTRERAGPRAHLEDRVIRPDAGD